jgi:hypothetical protein
MLLQPEVLTVGWQVWHTLFGLAACGMLTTPSMKHPGMQLPAVQISPTPQVAPLAALLQPTMLVPGSH